MKGPITNENIPPWHALKASDSDDIASKDDRRNEKKGGAVSMNLEQECGARKLIKAYLLNEERRGG